MSSCKIPVIIVLTKAFHIDRSRRIKDYLKRQTFEDVIDIVAKPVDHGEGIISRSYGLDKLVELTIKKCQTSFDGKKVYMEQLTKYINNNLYKKNTEIKTRINKLIKSDVVNKDLAKKYLDGIINDIYYYNVCYFLGKNSLSSESNSLIKESQFNIYKNNFFVYCQQYIKKLLATEVPYFYYTNLFLEIQAKKAKEKYNSLELENKRNYKDLMNTAELFLTDNFNYFSSQYYIYFVIKNISINLSSNFEQELNLIIGDLMKTSEIQELIGECSKRKFEDFSENVKKYPPFIKSGINDRPKFD